MNVLKSAAGSAVSGKVDLPFPTDPGEFWSFCLQKIYGPAHLLVGLGKSNVTYPDGSPMNVGPLLNGLIFSVGVGMSNQGGPLPAVQVKLDLLDLKMLNWDGGVCIEYDTTKPGSDCSLVTLDPKKVFDKFIEFANPLNWPRLAHEFISNPVSFCEREVAIFYPAGINLSFNVKGTIGKMGQGIVGIVGGHDLVNRDPIWICCANTPTFPPRNFGLSPRDPIYLVKEDNPKEVVAIVNKVETAWMHPAIEEKSEVLICQAACAGALSFDFVRDMVDQYLKPPKWP